MDINRALNTIQHTESRKIRFALIYHQRRKYPGGRENQTHYIWFSRAFCSEFIRAPVSGVSSCNFPAQSKYQQAAALFAFAEQTGRNDVEHHLKSPQAVSFSRVIDLRRVKPTDFTLRYGTDAKNTTARVYSRADRTKRDEE